MPLQRNNFVPQNMLKVYTASSGMADLRTGLAYEAGGLMVGIYYDLTEAEAQAQGATLHSGRYRFVQIDPQATAANVTRGRIGAMRSIAQGVNFITDYSHNLDGKEGLPRGVVFINTPTPAEILAGCYIFVQELGDASVMASRATDAGEALIVVSGGKVGNSEDLAEGQDSSGTLVGVSTQQATAADQLIRCILRLAIVQD